MTAQIAPAIRGKLVGTKELAVRCGVGIDCVRKWLARPKGSPIAYRLIEGQYKFDTADIDDFLAAAYVPAAPGGH